MLTLSVTVAGIE